jgi:Protein of unknown function (DUF3037)
MTGQRPYTYTVLRYVHDVRAGEMLNVGVLLHVASDHRLLIKTRHTFGRLKEAFPDLNGEAFRDAMRAVERAIGDVAGNELFATESCLKHTAGSAISLLSRTACEIQ